MSARIRREFWPSCLPITSSGTTGLLRRPCTARRMSPQRASWSCSVCPPPPRIRATATSAAARPWQASRARLPSRRSPKSRTRAPPRGIWRPENTFGTAAFSCWAHAFSSTSWHAWRPPSPPLPERPSPALPRIWVSCGSSQSRSHRHRASPSITRSWSAPAPRRCCRSMWAGAMSAPGPRSGSSASVTRKATPCMPTP